MSISGPPDGLLSPTQEIFPQHPQKPNSLAESRSSYFSLMSSRAAISRKGSPFEGPEIPSRLSLGLASPSYLSEHGSEYSSESQYLSPPQSKGDNEKPPYKARSLSAASLNMTGSQSGHVALRRRKHRAKNRQHKQKSRPLLQNNTENAQRSQEQVCPSCKEKTAANVGLDSGFGRLGTFIKSIGSLNKTSKSLADIKDYSSKIISSTADKVTTQRWRSVGIAADEPRHKNLGSSDSAKNIQAKESRDRSKRWNNSPNNDEIMRAVRARLTFREIPTNHLPTPATITLRKASGIPTDLSGESHIKAGADTRTSLLSLPGQWVESQPPASTYLITTHDVDFITNLIQSGFDVKKTAVDGPGRGEIGLRKPSITGRGVLPLPSMPAHLTATIADVHQAQSVPRVLFKDSRVLDWKPTIESIGKLSRALSLKIAPEVIWEDIRSRRSHTTSSKASSSSGGHGEVMDDPGAAWLLAQSSSVTPEGRPPHAKSQGEHQSEGNYDGDNSPTSRVFQWVFKEPTEEMVKALGPFPKQIAPDEKPQSPTVLSKRKSFPSISLFSPDVVSFPPLPSRKFTSDWISPLPDMSTQSSGDGKCLYGPGIDALVGSGTKESNASLHHVSEHDSLSRTTEPQRNSPSPDFDSQMRRKSVNLLHPHVPPRLGDPFKVGNAIGCSSGTRKKSFTQSVRLKINGNASEHHFHEDQTSWVKPRKDSGWPAPKTPSPEEVDSTKPLQTALPPFIQAHGQINKGILENEDTSDLNKGLTPLLLEPGNHSGIYVAMTGTLADGGNCEPNCKEKHVRGNRPLGSRNPSTDWIG